MWRRKRILLWCTIFSRHYDNFTKTMQRPSSRKRTESSDPLLGRFLFFQNRQDSSKKRCPTALKCSVYAHSREWMLLKAWAMFFLLWSKEPGARDAGWAVQLWSGHDKVMTLQSGEILSQHSKKEILRDRKTLGMPENTGFLGSVVANWLQKCVINLLSEWVEYVDRNAAEKSAAFWELA